MLNKASVKADIRVAIQEPIAIVGMGIQSAIGCSIKEISQSLWQGKQAFISSRLDDEFTLIHAPISEIDFQAALVRYPQKNIAFKLAKRAPRSLQHSVLAALEAWQQAENIVAKIPADRIGIVIGGQNINQAYIFEQFFKYVKSPEYVRPSYGMSFLDTNLIGVLSEVLQIRGESFQIGAASASGNACIIQGMKQLWSGAVDCCIVIGCMADLSIVELSALRLLGALGGNGYQDRPNQACRPFDTNHNGFIPGEACGCLMLTRDTGQALGYLRSYGMSLDANASTNPSIVGEITVMKQALARAGLAVDDVAYVNAHGTASVLGDEEEASAIHTLFQKAKNKPYINSSKSLVGHCLWSAGLVEAIITLLQLNNGLLHPNINLDEPIHPLLNFVGNKASSLSGDIGLNNSFGFGGINTSLIIEKG